MTLLRRLPAGRAWLVVVLGVAVSALSQAPAAFAAGRESPVGDHFSRNQVRFTAVTDSLIRLEWSRDGVFTDQATAVVSRPAPTGKATVAIEGADLQWGATIRFSTSQLTVTHIADGKPFSADNLRITWRDSGEQKQWAPGQPDPGNLGGTRHSLDGLDEGHLGDLPPGFLSRAGYFFYDDSASPLWRADGEWIEPRPQGERQDWYFCVYRHRYTDGLREWVNLTGQIPMLPRWAFGGWYSRYWPYSDREEREIINRFRAEDIPLDVLVIDVDWHLHGWESYDWNRDLFPDPVGFLRWVHDQGCKTTFNNHPGALPAADSHYDEVLRRLGLARSEHPDGVHFNLANKRDADAYMDVLHNPMIDEGIDFWWIDGSSAQMPGLDSQMWTSKVYYDGTETHTGKRSLIFARYGGPGCHRYPVGFSGDTHSQWGVLNFEIMYTAVAGNVAYPYWSHDIGGFLGRRLDPELYIRWVQFGALSPILRLHSDHGVREPWNYGPEALAISRKYFQLRYRLVPYLYSYSRLVHDTGTPLVRPLYLEYPELPEAYSYRYQYLLGHELLVAPIGTPGEGGVTGKEIYFAPGDWYDYETGELYRGPAVVSYAAPLDRCPLFVRAGGIIPMQPAMDYIGQKPVDPLTLDIFPGANGEFTLYEDDGVSLDYHRGAFAKTRITYKENRDAAACTVGPTQGRYEGQAERRTYLVTINQHLAPTAVSLNGVAMTRRIPRRNLDNADSGWYYDRRNSRIMIKLATSIRRPVRLTITGGVGREVFDLARRARAHRERADAALAIARERNLPLATGLLQQFEQRARSAVSALASAREVDAALRHEVAGLDAEATRLWVKLATSITDAAARTDVLSALMGIQVTTWVDRGTDAESAVIRTRISTTTPAPGMTAAMAIGSPGQWWVVGQPISVPLPKDGGLATLSIPVRRTAERLPGLLRFGGELAISWKGKSITRPLDVVVDNSYLQWFHLIGPFDNTDNKGFDIAYPPEQEIDFTKSYPGKEGEARWQTTEWAFPGVGAQASATFINLVPRFAPNTEAVAYAVTYLWSADPEEVVFSLGSDDGAALWVNGEKLFSHPGQRTAAPGQDRVPAQLRAGWNTVLMKIAQLPGDWGFYLQVTDPEGKPLPGVSQALNPKE